MAQMTNWLAFSLSPMEMLKSSTDHHHHHQSQFLSYDSPSSSIDNFYVLKEEADPMADPTTFSTFFDSQQPPLHHVPKLEDFLGDSSSSLTQIYNPSHHNVAGGVPGFYSGSEIGDESGEGYRTYLSNDGEFLGGHLVELGSCTNNGKALTLAVDNNNNANQQTPLNCNNGEAGEKSKKKKVSKKETLAAVVDSSDDSKKKIAETFGQRTSIYRGVTRHRWTGRYEAHLWDNSCRREGQARKGRQVYLGGYDKEDKAARAYDLAALKYWGPTATTNFQTSTYLKEMEEMNHMTKQEFIASLRRKSSGFSRGASMYRGVTRHHQQGRWQARIGRVAGNKDLYLGTFATEEEAAEAYDIAAIKFRGLNAVTNFEMNRYDVEAIMNSSFPLGGGAAKRHKLALESPSPPSSDHNLQQLVLPSSSSDINANSIPCGIPFDSSVLYHHHQNIFQHYPLVSDSTVNVPMMNQAEFLLWPNQSY